MIITNVSYRRKFNLGNYEALDCELTAAINETDTVEETLDELSSLARDWYLKKTAKKDAS
jgi:hypothetical protein